MKPNIHHFNGNSVQFHDGTVEVRFFKNNLTKFLNVVCLNQVSPIIYALEMFIMFDFHLVQNCKIKCPEAGIYIGSIDSCQKLTDLQIIVTYFIHYKLNSRIPIH